LQHRMTRRNFMTDNTLWSFFLLLFWVRLENNASDFNTERLMNIHQEIQMEIQMDNETVADFVAKSIEDGNWVSFGKYEECGSSQSTITSLPTPRNDPPHWWAPREGEQLFKTSRDDTSLEFEYHRVERGLCWSRTTLTVFFDDAPRDRWGSLIDAGSEDSDDRVIGDSVFLGSVLIDANETFVEYAPDFELRLEDRDRDFDEIAESLGDLACLTCVEEQAWNTEGSIVQVLTCRREDHQAVLRLLSQGEVEI
jgi:hypothetical protein